MECHSKSSFYDVMHISILLASAVPINHTTVLDLACILLCPVDQEHPVYQRHCTIVSFDILS